MERRAMSVNTNNIYGKISISDDAIARVAEYAALDCYGIVEMVNKRFTDSLSGIFKKGQRAWLRSQSRYQRKLSRKAEGYRRRGAC